MYRVLRRLQKFSGLRQNKIASYLMCCGEACHTSYAQDGLFMLAEKPSPRRFISYEEAVVYSLNCKGVGRQTAGFTGSSGGMRENWNYRLVRRTAFCICCSSLETAKYSPANPLNTTAMANNIEHLQ